MPCMHNLKYAVSHYPGAQFMEWWKQDKELEVELADGTEVEFDAQGNFKKMD